MPLFLSLMLSALHRPGQGRVRLQPHGNLAMADEIASQKLQGCKTHVNEMHGDEIGQSDIGQRAVGVASSKLRVISHPRCCYTGSNARRGSAGAAPAGTRPPRPMKGGADP